MSCYGPLIGFFSKKLNAGGKRSIVFDVRKSFDGQRLYIPCGKCVGCRLLWRRQWAVRCMHEKRLYTDSCFVTLTYEDARLPAHGSLVMRDLQLFMKRLRKVRPVGLRFFGCGEYGATTFRPHYHLLLFNTFFPDARFWKLSETGENLYKSAELRGLWNHGDNVIGAVSARSCAYVAGYVLKKCGPPVDYGVREPEFRLMSRRPGIGFDWFLKFNVEAYKSDSAIMDGREVGLPRYYDTKFGLMDEYRLFECREERLAFARSRPEENTRERLFVRERFELLKQERFKREGV